MPIDCKAAIAEDVKEIDLALSVLNALRASTWQGWRSLKKPKKENNQNAANATIAARCHFLSDCGLTLWARWV
jgi:hypothetical protein